MCCMCNIEEDETVEHVILEIEKYNSDRIKMVHVIMTETGYEIT